MKKIIFTFFTLIFTVSYAFAQSDVSVEEIIIKINEANVSNKSNKRVKEIVKEHNYRVGDDESKNTARKKALEILRTKILDEAGTYVEYYLEINKMSGVNGEYVKEEIKRYTSGSIKLTVIEEKYNGDIFYIKAKALIDPDSVSQGISEMLKVKANKNEIENLKKLLASKENEVDMRSKETISLQKKLSAQELVNASKEKEIKALKAKLAEVEKQISKQKQEAINIENEYARAQQVVSKAVDRIEKQNRKVCMIKKGMTKNEVIKAIGQPDGVSFNFYYYGSKYIEISYSTELVIDTAYGCR